MEFNHIPVLFHETIDALNINPAGITVDCTSGGGGHSAAVLERLSEKGRLICFDRDPDAIAVLQNRFGSDKPVTIVHENYSNISAVLHSLDIPAVDSVMADLGVSSYQLDEASRGFSFHHDAPLDMRMSKVGSTAADLVNTLPESALRKILFDYGEEKFAPRIAAAIVKQRQTEPILTTLQLAEVVSNAYPAAARRGGHPARKTFQALRIEINGELADLPSAIRNMFHSLKPGGRLAIISFHSLEDKIVKNTFTSFTVGCTCPPEFPVCVCGKKPQGKICFKPKTAQASELDENQRSRSAKLRAIEKILY
ncbi:MAG TPA: 16S rRNA (cytosine(1402)-N(4))-methyltransferase [Ruminococcaceae bacterium]|nr:16S rRNA (cytosine(1402)-N(4))-methyltransferase [Oscillospiraceae bacterium]